MHKIPHVLRRRAQLQHFAIAFLAILILLGLQSAAFAYNDHSVLFLRVTPEVESSHDYKVAIKSTTYGGGTGDLRNFTTGWIGLYVNNTPSFVQVGVIADGNGVRFFTYTDSIAYCQRGTTAWNSHGCIGNYNDLVSTSLWSRFELVTYGQGWWVARIWTHDGVPFDIARLYVGSTDVTHVFLDTEAGYKDTTINMDRHFYYWDPEYRVSGTSTFADWPAANATGQNTFRTQSDQSSPNRVICPPNGFRMINLPLRYFFIGTNSPGHTYYCSNDWAF